jgi:hypothetical protein
MPRLAPDLPKRTPGGRADAGVLLPLAAAAWLAVAAARMPILTPDVWWHLATGRLIAAQGIPRHDPFSYTLSGAAWTVHEWLADRIVFAAHAAGGLLGVVGLRAALLVAAAALAYRLARLHAGRFLALAGIAVAVWDSQRNWLDRPQLWSYALLPLVVGLLERDRLRPSRWVWSLPLVFVLWVNLHGSFLLGLAVVAIWLVARWKTQPLRRAATLMAACAAATLANPHGMGGALYPLHYVGIGLAETIREERAGGLDSSYAWVHWMLVLAWLALLAARWRSMPRPHQAIGTLLAALSLPRLGGMALPFAAERHAPLFLFAAVPLLVWQIAALLPARAAAAATRSRAFTRTTPAWIAAGVLAAFAFWQAWRAWPRDASPQARLLPGRFPVAAAAWIAAHDLPVRLLNPYRWGGYLEWTLWPQHEVWIDSRGDLYGAARLREDELLYRMPPGSDAVVSALLERDQPDVIVWYLLTLDFGSLQMHPFTRWLLARPDWRLVYWDAVDPRRPHDPAATTAVFLRVAPRNAAWLARLPPAGLPSGLPH